MRKSDRESERELNTIRFFTHTKKKKYMKEKENDHSLPLIIVLLKTKCIYTRLLCVYNIVFFKKIKTMRQREREKERYKRS